MNIADGPFDRIVVPILLEEVFRQEGLDHLAANELSEAKTPELIEAIEKEFQAWDAEMVPRPVSASRNGRVLFGLRSMRYKNDLPRHYFDVLDYVKCADEKNLLGIAVLANAVLGCDRIFVTDKGGGDAGVDILARLPQPIGQPCFLIATQCKAYSQPLSRLEVDSVWHRYQIGLDEKNIWDQYLSAMSAKRYPSSLGRSFNLVASNGLSTQGKETAIAAGISSSTPRQISYLLASKFDLKEIEEFCSLVPGTRDLSRDLSKEIPLVSNVNTH
ncbi:hypothetical protein [Nocardiopsis flavescens]